MTRRPVPGVAAGREGTVALRRGRPAASCRRRTARAAGPRFRAARAAWVAVSASLAAMSSSRLKRSSRGQRQLLERPAIDEVTQLLLAEEGLANAASYHCSSADQVRQIDEVVAHDAAQDRDSRAAEVAQSAAKAACRPAGRPGGCPSRSTASGGNDIAEASRSGPTMPP